MTGINPLAPDVMPLLALLLMRIGALVLIAPIFSARTVPVMFRTAFIVCLVMLMLPAAYAHAGEGVRVTPETIVTESLVGLALGFGAALVIAAAEFAGDVIGIQSGLSGATTLDPLTQIGTPVLGQFAKLLATTILFTVDGHLVLLDALWSSVRIAPPGAALHLADGALAMTALGADVFVEGLRFAAPVTAAVLISNIALGVLARATPQMNMFMVAYPLQIAIGLVTLMLALPLICATLLDWPAGYDTFVERLLATLLNGR